MQNGIILGLTGCSITTSKLGIVVLILADFMRGYLLISILCALFCVGFGDERNTNNAAASADPFSQKIDAEMVPDSLSVKCWGLREMAES